MRKPFRIFFLLMLVVSLPMRSMAGVATAECGMDHQAAVDGSAGHTAMLVHEMQDMEAHEAGHEDMPDHRQAAPQDEQPCDDCETASDVHEATGCGTCAQCCIGACAPPPIVVLTAVEEAVSSVQLFHLSSFTGHIRARIERPPRLA